MALHSLSLAIGFLLGWFIYGDFKKQRRNKMIKEKSWKEFRESGLLWFINTILHTFGWAIVVKIEKGDIKEVYPARVKFRGFPENNNTEGYKKVSKYLKENIKELEKEANEQ